MVCCWCGFCVIFGFTDRFLIRFEPLLHAVIPVRRLTSLMLKRQDYPYYPHSVLFLSLRGRGGAWWYGVPANMRCFGIYTVRIPKLEAPYQMTTWVFKVTGFLCICAGICDHRVLALLVHFLSFEFYLQRLA